MMRKAIGVSFLVLATVGGVMACSGDSKDEATGKSGSSGSGGASSAGSGGANSQSGSNATSGSNAGLCAGKMNMCVDAQTVTGCDPDTGMDFTVNCEEDVPEGLTNLGCDLSSQGVEACLLDFADPECWEGAQIFTVCAGGTTDEELIGFYLGCFHDMNGAKTVIPCYIPFADEATLMIDCLAADEACLPPGLGGGGAPSDGGAGPGPDPMGGAGGAD